MTTHHTIKQAKYLKLFNKRLNKKETVRIREEMANIILENSKLLGYPLTAEGKSLDEETAYKMTTDEMIKTIEECNEQLRRYATREEDEG